jgi:hypothetical protein
VCNDKGDIQKGKKMEPKINKGIGTNNREEKDK